MVDQTQKLLKLSLVWIGVAYFINFVLLGFLIGPFDYDHLSAYYELAWRFWRTGNVIPHFNPYFCGGRSMADPQVPIFSPLTLLVPLLGPTWLIKLELMMQLLGGIWGLFGIFRFFQTSPLGILWGILLYTAGGAVVSRLMVGHVTLGFYLLYPLFLSLSYRLGELPRSRLCFLYWALFIYAGLYKPNFLIYGLPLLTVEHGVRSIFKRNSWIFLHFLAGVLFCVGVNAVSYLPASDYFARFPRTEDAAYKLVPFYSFLANLIFPLKAVPEKLYGTMFMQRHEYNLFLGPVAIVFALSGLKRPWRFRAETISLLAMAVLSIWLGLGSEGGFASSTYTWFESFWPGFKSVRVPVRFWFGAYVALIVFSARGFQAPISKCGFGGFVLIGILPLLANSTVNVFKTSVLATQTQWTAERVYPTEITQVRSNPSDIYRFIRQGVGVLDCVNNMEAFTSRDLREGGLLAVSSPTPVKLAAQWRTWNRIKIKASHPHPFTLRLNLNHFPFWRFEGEGGSITSQLRSPLSISSQGSRLDGELVFEQPLVTAGAWISVATLALFVLLFLFAGGLRSVYTRRDHNIP